MTAVAHHLRSDRELALRAVLSRLAVTTAGLSIVRLLAARAILDAGAPVTLRERALSAALGWIAAAADGTSIAEVRTYASGALVALDAPIKRLEYWVEYTERRIALGTAGRPLR